MNILCVVGARPNFMKAAPVIEALRARPGTEVLLVHTGQHYDHQMSELFFEQLRIPRPDINLNVGSGPHGGQTGHIMIRFEPILMERRPDLVMVFGDVNSTIAGALCAAKMGIPVAHVEAGLRSFDRTMPEELNRILTDHLSDFLFVTEPSGTTNLLREGIEQEKIFFVGNVMVDTLVKHRNAARALNVRSRVGLEERPYGVLTLHRPSNVDVPETLAGIMGAIKQVSQEIPIVFPCHPRTRKELAHLEVNGSGRKNQMTGTERNGQLLLVDPLGYLEFLSLMAEARLVLTDSGGIQEETTALGIPCLTLRENTERPITLTQGTNVLVGSRPDRILEAASKVLHGENVASRRPDLWDGRAAERIVRILEDRLQRNSI